MFGQDDDDEERQAKLTTREIDKYLRARRERRNPA